MIAFLGDNGWSNARFVSYISSVPERSQFSKYTRLTLATEFKNYNGRSGWTPSGQALNMEGGDQYRAALLTCRNIGEVAAHFCNLGKGTPALVGHCYRL